MTDFSLKLTGLEQIEYERLSPTARRYFDLECQERLTSSWFSKAEPTRAASQDLLEHLLCTSTISKLGSVEAVFHSSRWSPKRWVEEFNALLTYFEVPYLEAQKKLGLRKYQNSLLHLLEQTADICSIPLMIAKPKAYLIWYKALINWDQFCRDLGFTHSIPWDPLRLAKRTCRSYQIFQDLVFKPEDYVNKGGEPFVNNKNPSVDYLGYTVQENLITLAELQRIIPLWDPKYDLEQALDLYLHVIDSHELGPPIRYMARVNRLRNIPRDAFEVNETLLWPTLVNTPNPRSPIAIPDPGPPDCMLNNPALRSFMAANKTDTAASSTIANTSFLASEFEMGLNLPNPVAGVPELTAAAPTLPDSGEPPWLVLIHNPHGFPPSSTALASSLDYAEVREASDFIKRIFPSFLLPSSKEMITFRNSDRL